jgi:hypothetical protein
LDSYYFINTIERKLLLGKKRKEQKVESTRELLLHGKKPKEQKVESTEGELLYDGEKPKEIKCPIYAKTLDGNSLSLSLSLCCVCI